MNNKDLEESKHLIKKLKRLLPYGHDEDLEQNKDEALQWIKLYSEMVQAIEKEQSSRATNKLQSELN